MMKDLFPFQGGMRKKLEPQIYRVFCTKCAYAEKVELENAVVTVWRNPDFDHSQSARPVSELPTLCPKCAAKLKKERIPVKLQY